MLRNVCVYIVLLVILGTGCARSSSPIIPSEQGRHGQYFTEPISLFDPDVPADKRAWDIDLAAVVVGPDGPAEYEPGDVWGQENLLGDPYFNYCAGVSLVRHEDCVRPVPHYVWMRNDPNYPENDHDVLWETEGYAGMAVCDNEFNFPRCDALLFYDQDFPILSTVELAVCYMYQPVPLGGDWDIVVTISTWSTNPFPPFPLLPFPFEDPISQVHYHFALPGTDEYHPDIAYDPYTGDIYLVYNILGAPSQVYYRRFDRETETWSDVGGPGYPIHGDDHSGWTPRIDVGLMDNLPPYADGSNVVGVAYSSYNQGAHETKWHPCVVYWETSEADGDKGGNLIPLWNQDPHLIDLNSGIPVIDIGPNSNPEHYSAITYIQEMGLDEYGFMQYRAYVVDTILNAFVLVQEPFYSTWNTIHPSVAIHYSGATLLREASISFFLGPADEPWCMASVCRINLDLPLGDPAKLLHWEYSSFLTQGSWDPLDMLDINPGLASSIVLRADHGYWAGFCDWVEFDDLTPPKMPYVMFGRTDGG